MFYISFFKQNYVIYNTNSIEKKNSIEISIENVFFYRKFSVEL